MLMNYKEIFTTTLLLTLIIGSALYTVYERHYESYTEAIEGLVAPVIDTTKDSKTVKESYTFCPTEMRYDIYQLKEKYFKDTQKLVISTVIHYFPNTDTSWVPDSAFASRVAMMNEFYEDSHTRLGFELDTVITHYGKPIEDTSILKSITYFESFLGSSRKDLRNYYFGEHVDFHNNVLKIPKSLNIYIYNDKTDFSGRAGDIESTYFGVNLKYTHPELYTLEHEAGHCFGIYHTHTYDGSGNPHGRDEGDLICDTYTTFPLSSIVDDNCELFRDWEVRLENSNLPPYSNPISTWDSIPDSEIEKLIVNVMSYTRHKCRREFTDEQVRRMRKILENNKDLRATIKGLDVDLKQNILKNLAEIK